MVAVNCIFVIKEEGVQEYQQHEVEVDPHTHTCTQRTLSTSKEELQTLVEANVVQLLYLDYNVLITSCFEQQNETERFK